MASKISQLTKNLSAETSKTAAGMSKSELYVLASLFADNAGMNLGDRERKRLEKAGLIKGSPSRLTPAGKKAGKDLLAKLNQIT